MKSLTLKEKRAWTVAIVLALVLGAYFVREYIPIILIAAISAFIFNPIHKWFLRRYKRPGISASLTFVISLIIIIIPVGLILLAIFFQVKHLVSNVSTISNLTTSGLSQTITDFANKLLKHIPGTHIVTTEEVTKTITNYIGKFASNLLHIITTSVGSISRLITSLIIFIYFFVNILMHQEALLDVVRGLDPLGKPMHDIYMGKMASMTKAMAFGQLLIAALQGTESAIILYIAGFHSLFLFFLILLTFMSLIPLGAGILTIPIGIGLILTGNIWQGALVIANHLLVVTNIDNVIRPLLVPKNAYLNSALTIVSVFAGIAAFGFLGIIVGPVIMSVIVTTIQTYVEMNSAKNISVENA